MENAYEHLINFTNVVVLKGKAGSAAAGRYGGCNLLVSLARRLKPWQGTMVTFPYTRLWVL